MTRKRIIRISLDKYHLKLLANSVTFQRQNFNVAMKLMVKYVVALVGNKMDHKYL